MKKISFRISILILISIFCSCDLDDDDGVNASLPEITSIGANTFGCRINGQVYLPRKGNFCLDCANTPKLSLKYGNLFPEGYRLSIFSFNDINGNITLSIDLFNGEIPFQEGQYLISQTYIEPSDLTVPNSRCFIDRKINGEMINSQFITTDVVTGILVITKIDEELNFISGTFNYEAVNRNGALINVTDGRFDIEIEPF